MIKPIPPPIPSNRIALTLRETAEALGVSERTIYTWTKTHGLPTFKIGQIVRIPIPQLLLWIESQNQQKTPGQPAGD